MLQHPALLDPWLFALEIGEGVVVGLLVETQGPAYRNLGAALAIAPDGRSAGAISSGCVEAEIIMQAAKIRGHGQVKRLRYGAGSPIFDLRLPCGGGIEVLLFEIRDQNALRQLAHLRSQRQPVSLIISSQGRLALAPYTPSRQIDHGFALGFRPGLRHVILGTGAEALTFAGLVAGLGHEHLLLSHDEMTLNAADHMRYQTKKLKTLDDLKTILVDTDTAITLFYHDHDHEPEILRYFLGTNAFYIGAQGSRRAQQTRLARLQMMGVQTAQLDRLRGPIGLIASTRSPQTLAVSVLAEIMKIANDRGDCALLTPMALTI